MTIRKLALLVLPGLAALLHGQPQTPQQVAQLQSLLQAAGFTGNVEASLPARLGRPINSQLAELGRLLWFDNQGGLHEDNTCAGCHSPTNGFGDTQSIAIGVQSNLIAGPSRTGPSNQRRTPMVINTAFYPKLMWNGRFFAPSGDPFNNSGGFVFPAPEGNTAFPPGDPRFRHLLVAQAHIPPTELVKVAGFTGTAGTIGPRFDQFDDGKGTSVPLPDGSGFRNEPIRQVVLSKLNATPAYRTLFGQVVPEVAGGAPIDFVMFGKAIAEFEFTLTFANAPIDKFARGDRRALNPNELRGAITFFSKGRCVNCHAVGGASNEMFSDFENHAAGVPQIAPYFGVGKSNMIYDGPGEDEDFGLEQISGNPADRYRFRTPPSRNVLPVNRRSSCRRIPARTTTRTWKRRLRTEKPWSARTRSSIALTLWCGSDRMPKTNREIAQEFFAASQQGNADAMCRLLHPQVVFRDWAFENLTGDGVHAMWRGVCTAQFGRRLDRVFVPGVEVASAEGDKAKVRYRVHYELFRDQTTARRPDEKPDHVVDYSIRCRPLVSGRFDLRAHGHAGDLEAALCVQGYRIDRGGWGVVGQVRRVHPQEGGGGVAGFSRLRHEPGAGYADVKEQS